MKNWDGDGIGTCAIFSIVGKRENQSDDEIPANVTYNLQCWREYQPAAKSAWFARTQFQNVLHLRNLNENDLQLSCGWTHCRYYQIAKSCFISSKPDIFALNPPQNSSTVFFEPDKGMLSVISPYNLFFWAQISGV